ncbi:substrate-binding domain-containing protein [Streptomyces sp. NPDC007808]|uniref:substrate-binding domain-containing protein n=1 Tax=Streptomyces sp. NPDC007808 TaxID=3364779 RepID=UPI0036AEF343
MLITAGRRRGLRSYGDRGPGAAQGDRRPQAVEHAEAVDALEGRHDITAVAGLSVAAERGLRVPADVSPPAWDDSQLCRLTHPTLSAMSHDLHGFGAEGARTPFGVITGDGPGSYPVPTPALTPGGSTAPPKV